MISCKSLKWEDIELSLLDELEGTSDEKAAKTAFVLKRMLEVNDDAFSDERAAKVSLFALIGCTHDISVPVGGT